LIEHLSRRGFVGYALAYEPSLGPIFIHAAEGFPVAVESVVRDADGGSGWDGDAGDGGAAGEDFAGEEAWYGGGETHGFVETGAEVRELD
jgi:hypothetical protein